MQCFKSVKKEGSETVPLAVFSSSTFFVMPLNSTCSSSYPDLLTQLKPEESSLFKKKKKKLQHLIVQLVGQKPGKNFSNKLPFLLTFWKKKLLWHKVTESFFLFFVSLCFCISELMLIGRKFCKTKFSKYELLVVC